MKQTCKTERDCFHTRTKCVIWIIIWIIIWITHFELRSVHTREVIAIFELRSVHTRDRIWDLAFQSGRRMSGYPANHTCTELAFPVFLYICSAWYYRPKGLEDHLIAPPPPPKSQFRGQGIHIWWFRCLICEMRNWKTPPDRHLKCTVQMTHRDVIWPTHGPKYSLSNFN